MLNDTNNDVQNKIINASTVQGSKVVGSPRRVLLNLTLKPSLGLN